MSWVAVAVVGGTIGGGLIAGNSTRKAQQGANAANAAIADQQSRDALNAWLMSRGVNVLGLTNQGTLSTNGQGGPTAAPDWEAYLTANPDVRAWAVRNGRDPLQFAAEHYYRYGINEGRYLPTVASASESGESSVSSAVNTTLPLWATIGDKPAEQWLFDRILTTSGLNGDGTGPTVDPRYQALQDNALTTAESLYNGGMLDTELAALSPALAARAEAARLQHDRNTELRNRIGDVYSAELTAADAFGNSAMEAVNRAMAQQQARRAVQGFSGGSSFDDLTRARTLAPAITQGALARAQADVNKATRMGQVLDADANIAQQNAKLQNALDRLNFIVNDQERRRVNVGLPGQLYQQQQNMETMATEDAYRDIDAFLRRMGLFSSNNATPPTPVYAKVEPVMGTGQIWGSAIQSGAQALGSMYGGGMFNQRPAMQPGLVYGTAPISSPLPGTPYNGTSATNPLMGTLCWVAREVYGESNPKWLMFREWLLERAPAWFRRAYIKHGEHFARWVHDKPRIKHAIRLWMDARIAV